MMRRLLHGHVLVVAVALVPACATSGVTSHVDHRPVATAPGTGASQPASMRPFTRVHHALTGGYPEPVELAVTSDSAWRAAWGAAWPNRSAGAPAVPAVDFARDVVLIVAAGSRPSGGYDIHVDAVERDGADDLVVRYTLTSPGPGCLTTQVVTSPVEIVRAPRAAGAVRFVARRAVQPC